MMTVMKLRFHKNSLRFRLNRLEVSQLASGEKLVEEIWFPHSEQPFRYSLGVREAEATAQLEQSPAGIHVSLNLADVMAWAASDELDLHRSLTDAREPLILMVEKDLVCVDGPAEERDPLAFPRAEQTVCN